jgi:hypothetical protein
MISKTDYASTAALDFSAIKAKLMHEACEGWSRERTDAVECEYRRFLFLMKAYPNESTAPLVDVDTFWHYHILDTMKYAADCQQVFGYFLHHYPYLGLHGEEDEQLRLDSGERMRELYEATFGVAYPTRHAAIGGDVAYCGSAIQAHTAYCGAAVKAQTTYCGAVAKAAIAYCGAAIDTTAYCGAAIRPDTAYCGAAVKAQTAYCGAAVQAAAAYCGAAARPKAVQALAA